MFAEKKFALASEKKKDMHMAVHTLLHWLLKQMLKFCTCTLLIAV